MSDLERARAHLLHSQAMLAGWRILSRRKGIRFLDVGWAECALLAALSWVWEEQEKDPRTQAERLIALAASVRERVASR